MPIYMTEWAIANVQNVTGVHALPWGLHLVTGVSAPDAAPGTKNLSGVARCRSASYAKLGYVRYLDGALIARSTLRGDVDTGRVDLGLLRAAGRARAVRGEVSTMAPQDITYIGASAMQAAASGGFAITAPAHAVGDLLVVIANGPSSGWSVAPSGAWSVTRRAFSGVFWRVADGTSNDNITLTPINSSTKPNIAQMFVYRNVDTVNGPFAQWVPATMTSSNDWWLNFSGFGTGLRSSPVAVGADTTLDQGMAYGSQLWPKAHALVFMVYDGAQNSVASPTLTEDTGAGNTPAESATFPYTLDADAKTALGTGGGISAFRYANTGAQIDGYAAGGLLTINTGATNARATIYETVLRPKGITPNTIVTLDGALTATSTAACDLTRVAGVQNDFLDGVLTARVTATADLRAIPGKMLDGVLMCKSRLFGLLYAPHPFDTTLASRSVVNATLTVGTTHRPAALLPVKSTARAALTVNYMRALLKAKASAAADLSVTLKLSGTSAAHASASADLTVVRSLHGAALGRSTATARLTLPLRGVSRCRSTSQLALAVTRAFGGAVAGRSSASMNLLVQTRLAMFGGAVVTAWVDLGLLRALAVRLRARSSASATLDVARPLAGTARCRSSARLVLTIARPTPAPIGTEITVSPDSTLEVDPSSVQVESAHDAAYVDEH
jgi:hypothetical protein